MAVKLDKDAILEQLNTHKDRIFAIVLVVVALYGGWQLYQISSRSVQQIIAEYIDDQTRSGAPQEEAIDSQVITNQLVSKVERAVYQIDKEPFGSPEDQLRLRQEVQQTYERGVELYDAKQFQQSIQYFDRVITLDVTETRINYPVSPSEYKRRAQREYARDNFDRIFQTAQTDKAEGDRLVQEGKTREALNVYDRSATTVSEVIAADPNGEIIGEENLTKLKDLQQQISTQLRELQKNLLTKDITAALDQARSALQGNNLIAVLQARVTLLQIQAQINQVDPMGQIISQTLSSQIESSLEQCARKLEGNAPQIVGQAETQFNQAFTQNDLQETQQSIAAMRQAVGLLGNDQGEARAALVKKVNDYSVKRADLVIQQAQDFYTSQKSELDKGVLDQFDPKGKQRFLIELGQVLDLAKSSGVTLPKEKEQAAAQLQRDIVSLRLPPPLTEAYDFTSVQASSANSYSIKFLEKTGAAARTPREQTIRLGVGQKHARTEITLKQVDTDRGVVILFKPGYSDTEINISSN